MKRNYLKVAGIINLVTAMVHLVAGQIDLVVPLVNSNLEIQAKGEFVAVWHMITILLFLTAFLLLKAGFGKSQDPTPLKSIGMLYILFGIPFIFSSIWFSIFAPQWILLMPIGIFTLLGIRKVQPNK